MDRRVCQSNNHLFQRWTRPVARFQDIWGRQNTFLRGKILVFNYMFNTFFSGHNKICGVQNKFEGELTRESPRGYGPVQDACCWRGVWDHVVLCRETDTQFPSDHRPNYLVNVVKTFTTKLTWNYPHVPGCRLLAGAPESVRVTS